MIHYDLVYCPCLYCHSLCVVYLVRIDFVHFFDCLFIFVLPFKIKYIDYINRFDPATFQACLKPREGMSCMVQAFRLSCFLFLCSYLQTSDILTYMIHTFNWSQTKTFRCALRHSDLYDTYFSWSQAKTFRRALRHSDLYDTYFSWSQAKTFRRALRHSDLYDTYF